MSTPPRTTSISIPAQLGPGFDFGRIDYAAALRASLCIAIPFAALYAADRLDLGVYAAFASFTAIYGRDEPYRHRVWTVASAGALNLAAVVAGILLHAAGPSPVALVIGVVVVVAVCTAVSRAMHWIPRGAIFFLFGFLVCALAPADPSTAPDAIALSCAVAVLGFLIGMSGALLRLVPAWDRALGPLGRVPVRRTSAAWDATSIAVTVATLVGAGVSWAIVAFTGAAEHVYWTTVTVAAIFSGPNALTSYERTGMRVVGTLVGIGVAAALFGGSPSVLYVCVVIVLCQFATEATIAIHYGVALAFLTPLAIGASNVTGASDWAVLYTDRARDTLVAGAVCFAIIVLVRAWVLRRARRGRETALSRNEG